MSKYGFRRVAAVGDQVIDLGWTHHPKPQPAGPLPSALEALAPRVPRTPAAAAELRAALDHVNQLAAPPPSVPPPAPKPAPKPKPAPVATPKKEK